MPSDIWHYQAFGLHFASEIELPDLTESDNSTTPRVHVRRASSLSPLESPTESGVYWRAKPGHLQLDIPNECAISVKDGCLIEFSPVSDLGEERIHDYFMGTVMGALLQQRGYLVLHAAAVVHQDHALLICGRSGSGKSTLVRALSEHCQATMSDDLVAVTFAADGTPWAHGSFPRNRLCGDAAEYFQVAEDTVIKPARRGPKYVASLPKFTPASYPIRQILGLRTSNRSKPERELLTGAEAVAGLSRWHYRKKTSRALGLRAQQFAMTSKLATKADVFQIFRPVGLENLPQLLEMIIGDSGTSSEP